MSPEIQKNLIDGLIKLTKKTMVDQVIDVKWSYHWDDPHKGEVRVIASTVKDTLLCVQGVTLSESSNVSDDVVQAVTKLYRNFIHCR